MKIKKIFNLFMIIVLAVLTSNTCVYSQKKSKKNSVTFDETLHESVEYREIGPFRGGRSAAVVGVEGNPKLFYFGATGGGDFAPTVQGVQVKNELIEKVNVQLTKYDKIISEDIPNFNSSFKKLELDYLNVF